VPLQVGGYWHKILHVNLTERKHWVEDIQDSLLRTYLGGRGLGIKLLADIGNQGPDPLSPNNPVILLTGPLTGTPFPSSSRTVLVTISPLTGIYLYSVVGGKFGKDLKKAGYDAVIIDGMASDLSVLVIKDGKVEIEEVAEMRGFEVTATVEAVQTRFGDALSTLAIGPAGENMVKFASITSNDNRSLGRGGAGAVMGSKKLKAIAVSGSLEIIPFNKEGFSLGLKRFIANVKENPGPRKDFRRYGTADGPEIMSALSVLPTRNWSRGTFDQAWKISMPYLREEGGYVRRDTGCHSCIVRCSKEMAVKEGEFAGAWNEGPEYETLYALGSNLEIDSPEFIIHANQRCDELGIDTMSAGVAIGFVMECFEKGILTTEDTDGIELRFGNYQAASQIIELIAQRRGIGDFIAEGTKRMAEKLGKGTSDFAMHVKGMELGGYDPRGALGQAIVYAAGNRGGCHHSIGLSAHKELNERTSSCSDNKGILVRGLARERMVIDSLTGCTFAVNLQRHMPMLIQMLRALTGWDWDAEELLETGDRINTLERAYNCRNGYTNQDDILPPRLYQDQEPQSQGSENKKGISKVDLQKMLREYYGIMGWDPETGITLNR